MHCPIIIKTLYLKIKPLLNVLQQEREGLVCVLFSQAHALTAVHTSYCT